MPKSFLSLRVFQLSAVVLVVFSLLSTQVPLFNYLGFEFSALTSLLASFVSGFVSLSIGRNLTTRDRARTSELFHTTTKASLALLSIPFIIMSLNVFFIKNCSYLEGAVFYFLTPIPGVLFSNAFACLIAASFGRWKKTLFAFWFALVLIHIPAVTFTGIQIFAFNPIVGFFPGFTYDETLNVTPRLFAYRVGTVIQILFIWLLIEWVRARKATRAEWRDIVPVHQRWLGSATVIVAVLILWFSDDLGLSSSASHVKTALGGEIETEHFVINYPSSFKQSKARELGAVHEFYFSRIASELRVNPRRKIYSYVYLSAEQKGKLVGAGRTNITKPWLWQIHINQEDIESTLKHELVHVMAADFGFPLLRIGPNPGLIEGLAVAVERTTYESVVHRTAAEVFAVGLRPNLEGMFSWSGFLKAYPGVSYSLAGSFCRYLIDRHGLRRFKRVYRSGDFLAYYNRDLSQLIREWKEHLSRFEVKENEKVRATYFFKRPSIFGKECARVIANLNAETRSLYGRHDYVSALLSSDRSLRKSISIEAVFQKTNSLVRMGQYSEAIEFGEQQINDSSLTHALLPLRLALGDAYWAIDRKDRALNQYQFVFDTHISLTLDEACALRVEAIFAGLDDLRSYFLGVVPDSLRADFLRNIPAKIRDTRASAYLLGRELSSKERFQEAIDAFLSIETMNSNVLEYLRERRIAFLYIKIGEFQKAKIHFWRSMNNISNEAQFLETDEWLKRCDWMEEHTAKPNL